MMHLGLKYMVIFNTFPSRTTVEGFLMTKTERGSKGREREQCTPERNGKPVRRGGGKGQAADHPWGATSPHSSPTGYCGQEAGGGLGCVRGRMRLPLKVKKSSS